MDECLRDWAQVYQSCFAELRGYLMQIIGDRGVAEDLAQEAGLRLLAGQVPAELRSPRAFLFHVATNLARDHLRRNVVRQRHAGEEPLLATEVAPPEDVVVGAQQELQLLAERIGRLPERPRQVLLLSRIEGHSHAEIGQQLGISAKTVENHLARAMAMLVESAKGRT